MKKMYKIIPVLLILFCFGCTNKNYDLGKLVNVTCSKSNPSEDGLNGYFVSTGIYINNNLKSLTSTLIQQVVSTDQIPYLYGYMVDNTEIFEDIEGVNQKITKSDNCVIYTINVDYDNLDKEKYSRAMKENDYGDPDGINANTSINEFITIQEKNGYTCYTY